MTILVWNAAKFVEGNRITAEVLTRVSESGIIRIREERALSSRCHRKGMVIRDLCRLSITENEKPLLPS